MDGRNTTFLLGRPIFRGYVRFRECITPHDYSVLACRGTQEASATSMRLGYWWTLMDVDGNPNPMKAYPALKFILPETNVAPENRGPLEKEIHIGNHYV